MAVTNGSDQLTLVCDLEVDSVQPQTKGFHLEAVGRDASKYLMEIHLEMPADRRTRAIVGEMLAQSEIRVWRRPAVSLKSPRPRAK